MVINKEMNIVSCSDNCQNIDIFYATRNTWWHKTKCNSVKIVFVHFIIFDNTHRTSNAICHCDRYVHLRLFLCPLRRMWTLCYEKAKFNAVRVNGHQGKPFQKFLRLLERFLSKPKGSKGAENTRHLFLVNR